MHKVKLKWSLLTNVQRDQVKQHHQDDIKRKKLFEHNLNQRSFNVNPLTGNVLFS